MSNLSSGETVGSEMLFDFKAFFFYRTSAKLNFHECLTIRKQNWRQIVLQKYTDEESDRKFNELIFNYKKKHLCDFINKVYFPV